MFSLSTAAVSAQVVYVAQRGVDSKHSIYSLDLMKDKTVESTGSFGYFSLEEIDLSFLHSSSKNYFVVDKQYAR